MLEKIIEIFNEENINSFLKSVVNDVLDVGVDVFDINPDLLPINFEENLLCIIPPNSYIPEEGIKNIDRMEHYLNVKTIIRCWNTNTLVEIKNKKHLNLIFILIEVYNDKLHKLKEQQVYDVMSLKEIVQARNVVLKMIENEILEKNVYSDNGPKSFFIKQIEENIDLENKRKIDITPTLKEFYKRKNPLTEKERQISNKIKEDFRRDVVPDDESVLSVKELKKVKKEKMQSYVEKSQRLNMKNALDDLIIDE